MRRVGTVLVVVTTLALVGGAAHGANFTLITQDRSVSGSAYAEDLSENIFDSDSDMALDAGPFVTGASAQAEVAGAIGSGGGTQDSTILVDGADLSGSAFATGESFDFDSFADGSGQSRFEITFTVSSCSTYTLSGEISAFDSGIAELRLSDSSGFIFDAFAFGPAETVPINESGTLVPGQYSLLADVQGSAFGSSFSSEFAFAEFLLTFRVQGAVCVGDLDGDDDTDVFDFGLFSTAFGTSAGDPDYQACADYDGNGTIDVFDFAVFGPDFGCPN